MRLALGTVQFGTNYGITNQSGCPEKKAVEKILVTASELGIDLLDTAQAYGHSEAVLGEILGKNHSFKIVTKISPLNVDVIGQCELDKIFWSIDQSLAHLNQTSLYGLLIHRAEDLLLPGGDVLFSKLRDLKDRGQVKKIGVSAYSFELLEKLMNLYPIDLAQVPANILDQRITKFDIVSKMKSKGVEIHVRSAFLQGVLLKDLEQLPHYFSTNRQLRLLQDFVHKSRISRAVLALNYLKQCAAIDKILIGVLSHQELLECFDAYCTHLSTHVNFDMFICDELNFIDPSKWSII